MKLFSLRNTLLLAAAFSFLLPVVHAEESVKDIPYLTVMPKYQLTPGTDDNKTKEFDEYPFFDGKKFVPLEGRLWLRRYNLKDGETAASALQIARNVTNAIKAAGGTVVYEGKCSHEKCGVETSTPLMQPRSDAERLVTGRLNKGGKEIWLEMAHFGFESYNIVALEREAMKQDIAVSASDMLKAINAQGRISLHILFDTGKATIRPDSDGVIAQILELLKTNPQLKLAIEGHTDNVGNAKANLKLSQDRAAAVMAALVKQGIAANRLGSAGFGQDKPVADNKTEDGRSKNRRVDLVKQ